MDASGDRKKREGSEKGHGAKLFDAMDDISHCA